MRLQRLFLKHFKNLRDLEVRFSDVFTTVLVGRNGTGKSNVLEALIIAFRDLDLGDPPSFTYELEYTCRGSTVVVDADPDRRSNSVRIQVNGKIISRQDFARKGESAGAYLPNYVFGYYSGPSNRMETHFEQHQTRFDKALRQGIERALRPLFYARLVHSQFALLSFFQRDGQPRGVLQDPLRIQDLESVLFVLKKPGWATQGRLTPEENPGDPRFWGAQGVVRDFLSRIYDLSLAPVRTGKNSRLYLYLESKEKLYELAKEYHALGAQEFFKALESLYVADLIESVRTRVRLGGVDEALTFRELSEGEQQLLMVLGLLQFIQDREALFLLDEPDTHLNPAWSLRYTELLKQNVSNHDTSQIVMATHDPLVVAGLTRTDVLLMQRNGDTGRITADHPQEDPQGMGVSGLLTSELYGLRSDLDLKTLGDLDLMRELSIKPDLSVEERQVLAVLEGDLEDKAFTRTTGDPLFDLFAKVMTQVEMEEDLRAPVLSEAERERREDVAIQIARRLKAEFDQKRGDAGAQPAEED